MKVLHIINIGGIAGAEKMLLQLLPAMQAMASTGCLIFHQENNSGSALIIAGELRLSGVPVIVHAYRKVYEKSVTRKITAVVDAGGYDIIHSHLKQSDFWLAILKFRGKLRVPVVSTMHSYTDRYENRFGFRVSWKIYLSWYYHLTRLIYRQLDGFIMISKIVDEFFRKVSLTGNKKKAVIYHGYDAGHYQPVPEPGRNGSNINLTLPGRLIVRKGHRYAIDAFKLVLNEFPQARLNFFGTGTDEALLKDYAKEAGLADQVIFHGYAHNLMSELGKADVVIIPSLWEAFGLVFLDSFAAGVPVVAFDLAASNEIIKDGYSGLLADANSSSSLAGNILRLLHDRALAKKIASNARQEVLSTFSMGSMIQKYISFYQDVIELNR